MPTASLIIQSMKQNPLLTTQSIDQPPADYINRLGKPFARFDEQTQDSGNLSYGIQLEQDRYFIKTAGLPDDTRPFFSHAQRVDLLRNAIILNRTFNHHALPRLQNVIESPYGPMLIYEWVAGECIGTPSVTRHHPISTFQRFRSLPVVEILQALDVIYELHYHLAQAGWIAVDFYDGALIYDFERQTLRVMDLDLYHQGPFINEMGRMFGSSRFMAPEELERGSEIDQRTNVFTMGRTAAVFLSDGTLQRSAFRGDDALYKVVLRACHDIRDERYGSLDEFYQAWHSAKFDE